MKRTPKLITNYSYMNDSELASLAARSRDALSTNTNFPDMTPTFAQYEPLALGYITKQAVTAAHRASTLQSDEKDEARDALLKSMRAITGYINNFTSVSSIQLSSGFLPVGDRKATQVPPASAWTDIVDSNRPGEILLKFQAIKEAHEYEVAVTAEVDAQGNPVWPEPWAVPRALGNFYAPVEDGVTYYFRVRSRNKKGVSHWSPVASLRARFKP